MAYYNLAYIQLSDIKIPGKMNTHTAEIMKLAENIKRYGLRYPLTGYYSPENMFILIGGKKRYYAIRYGVEHGYPDWFTQGIPCLISAKPSSYQEELELSLVENFCPQEKSRFDLDTIEEWYRSLPPRKRQDTPVKELLSLLDVGERQAQKIVSIIKCADQVPWLLDAYGQGVITLDQAALIAHFSEDNRAKLGETYEASGELSKETIDSFRKKNKN